MATGTAVGTADGIKNTHSANTLRTFLKYICRNPAHMIGFIIVVISIVMIFLGPALAPYEPEKAMPGHERLSPSINHLFGTDAVGMDVFSRVLAAAKIDVTIALLGTFFSVFIGIPLGLFIGYYPSIISEVIARAADLIQAFPVFILAMVLTAIRGGDIVNIIFAIAFVNAPIYMRLMRSQALELKNKPYVEAAKCAGNSDSAIIFRHILPNSLAPLFAQATVNLGWAILLTSGISFIGAGVKPPTAEWGLMVAMGASEIILGEWWTSLFPGLAIAITVLGYALFGEAVQGFLNTSVGRS